MLLFVVFSDGLAQSSDCPAYTVNVEAVNAAYAAACYDCVGTNNQNYSDIPRFEVPTSEPIDVTITSIPTLIATTFYTPTPTLTPTSTPTGVPTSTPTPTPANACNTDWCDYYDFLISSYDGAVVSWNWLGSGTGKGFWSAGSGWGGNTGFGVYVDFPYSIPKASLTYIKYCYYAPNTGRGSFGLQVGVSYDPNSASGWTAPNNMTSQGGTYCGTFYPNLSALPADIEGMVLASSYSGTYFTAIREVWIGGSDYGPPAATATPYYTPTATFTPMPTSTPYAFVDCSQPENYLAYDGAEYLPFEDALAPTVNELGLTCLTIIPEIDFTLISDNLFFAGVELCIHWFALPSLSLFGITIPLSLIFASSVAWLLNKFSVF